MLLSVKSEYITGINDIITGIVILAVTISVLGLCFSITVPVRESYWLPYRYWDDVSRLQYRYGNITSYHIGTGMMCLDYITGTVIVLVTISVLGWCVPIALPVRI